MDMSLGKLEEHIKDSRLRRLLCAQAVTTNLTPDRISWTARRSNQSVLKEINLEYLLGGLMLKLKLQYFGHLMQRTDKLEKTLMLRKIEDKRKRRQRG